MKLQKITASQIGAVRTVFAGSQSEAAGLRKQLVSEGGYKRADITTTEVDVPTDKKGLLEWLNANFN
jgi:hypothetical protein